jgi:hypothetical protein
MDPAQVLAFRLARSGLAARREAGDVVAAAACPASDFARDAALLALAARVEGVTREAYDGAVEAGELAVAHAMRAAIHLLRPVDVAVYGRALVGRDERELKAQLGQQVSRLGVGFADALETVVAATADALAAGPLGKDDLHAALRERVGADLLPWCPGCRSHHVPPALWRYATILLGARLDAQRRYVAAAVVADASGGDAVRGFLRFYGPARPEDFAGWAGVTPSHARRLWKEVETELVEAGADGWLLAGDAGALESPPAARGVRLLPPGDPFLQKPNRPLLAPDPELHRRLFRPAGSPGVVLSDGRLAGLWRLKRSQLTVEPLAPIPPDELEAEAQRVATARGIDGITITT